MLDEKEKVNVGYRPITFLLWRLIQLSVLAMEKSNWTVSSKRSEALSAATARQEVDQMVAAAGELFD